MSGWSGRKRNCACCMDVRAASVRDRPGTRRVTTSRETEAFVTHLVDLMQSIGPVLPRRMFGGYGIFLDGLMFGLVADDTLYFKADASSVGEFRDAGLEPFTYSKHGKVATMSYYQAPEEVLEDVEQMRSWANKAYAAALRAAAAKRSR